MNGGRERGGPVVLGAVERSQGPASARKWQKAGTTTGGHGPTALPADLDTRTRALKERLYASFTGLAILAALSRTGHGSAADALLSLSIGVFGISAAGFLAEVVSHQVAHQRLPAAGELRTMARIALGALGTASVPVIALALAWGGIIALTWGLWSGMALYAATLVAVTLIAVRRSGLPSAQRLFSSAMLLGLAVAVVALLQLAHRG
jgi:hypothetical protein